MNRLAPGPEDVVQALEVLANANDAALKQGFASAASSLGGSAGIVRDLLYRGAVGSLERALVAQPLALDPSTARAAQATENVWRRVESEFGLLSSAKVSGLLGASNANRAFASELRKRGELLGAQRKNAYVFPGFQFDFDGGAIRPWVRPLLRVAAQHDQPAAAVVMWMMTPTTFFDGARPADRTGEPQRLVEAAERAWGVEW